MTEEWVLQLRLRGFTNQEFAFMLGKKPSEVSRWLSGTHNFTTETLWLIEKVLKIQLLTSSPLEQEVSQEQENLKDYITNEVQKALSKYFAKSRITT